MSSRTRPPIELEKSLARVKAGGIPTRAEERLAEEKGAHRRLFTSDLSVSEFLLARDAGCEPIAQVMGSSVFHVGQISSYRGETKEVTAISDAHRRSRRLALDRLQQEAALVDADAVVGVRIRDRMITMGSRGKGGDNGGEVLEFTVIGTAVKAPWMTHPEGKPILTDLSGQDVWALHQDGFQPCGFLFESRHRRALRLRSFSILKPHAPRLQQHKEVKHEICALGAQMISVVLDRSDHRLDGFLAEFLGAMPRALIKQLSGVGRIAARYSSGVDGGSKIVDRETRHITLLVCALTAPKSAIIANT